MHMNNYYILYFSTYTEYVINRFTHVLRPVLASAINDKCAQARAKKDGQKYTKK